MNENEELSKDIAEVERNVAILLHELRRKQRIIETYERILRYEPVAAAIKQIQQKGTGE
jgi:hypothetical protein